ncbi:MAG: hydrogenase maturation protease [Planctomycetales bacterium]
MPPNDYCILALGSPHGDDRVAWQVAENLSAEPALSGRVHKLASPFEIVEHFENGAAVVVIDVSVSGSLAGMVRRIDGDRLKELPAERRSTHGGSLADALRLAEALGRRPARLVVLAVEIEPPVPGIDLTTIGRECVRRLEADVRAELSLAPPPTRDGCG